MITVRILTSNADLLQRQIDNTENIVNNIKFSFGNDITTDDYVVVIDDIEHQLTCPLDKSHRILYTGEPPYVKLYPSKFLRQFGNIYSCQIPLIKAGVAKGSIPVLPWMLGYKIKNNTHEYKYTSNILNYHFFKNTDNLERLDKICLITSNKKLTKGHVKRVEFAIKLKEQFPDIIDIFGNGFNHIDDKYDVLSKYKYGIIIENCSYDNYFTEKLSDCYLAGCYPIYYGATNINQYFNNDEITIIDINNYKESVNTIMAVLDSKKYEASHGAIIKAKNKILDKYNMFNIISENINKINQNKNENLTDSTTYLYNIHFSFYDKLRMYILKWLSA